MPTPVGQIEKKTQERVLALLSQRMGYTYLGDWIDRPTNANIEVTLLKVLARRAKASTIRWFRVRCSNSRKPPTTPARASTIAIWPSTDYCATV